MAQGKLVAEQYSEALDIRAATASISWSLAKSVTSALIGIRSGMGGLSVHQRATTPVWNASETMSRNITRAYTAPILNLLILWLGLGLFCLLSPVDMSGTLAGTVHFMLAMVRRICSPTQLNT